MVYRRKKGNTSRDNEQRMMKLNYSRFLPVLLISFTLIFNSCSVIGYKLGAKYGSGIKIVDPADFETIKKSQKITLNLNDKSIRVGEFVAVFNQKLVLRNGLNVEYIKLDEINNIELKTTRTGKLKGAFIGLFIDTSLLLYALFVAAVASTADN